MDEEENIPESKKCFYETLEISRDASSDEIKLKYRKLALKWHPDKNVGNEEEATETFKQIQHAYSVLSDAKERKWYDEHREEILRGHSEDNDHEFVPNLFPYFNLSAFSGFGDDKKGFYAVYLSVFKEIDDKEQSAFYNSSTKGVYDTLPIFGSSQSEWAEVEEFYSHWQSFTTKLNFSWEDQYNEMEAPNRMVRRAMEKENRASRNAAKKKYQDEVRALVDFCKRRDKRVVARRLEMRRLKEEKSQKIAEQKARKLQEMQERRKHFLKEQQQMYEDMEKQRELEDGAPLRLADESSEDEKDSKKGKKRSERRKNKKKETDNDVETIYWCPACRKEFKSEKQMKNHEKSKAHKKKMEKYVPEPEENIQKSEEEVQLPPPDPYLDEDYIDAAIEEIEFGIHECLIGHLKDSDETSEVGAFNEGRRVLQGDYIICDDSQKINFSYTAQSSEEIAAVPNKSDDKTCDDKVEDPSDSSDDDTSSDGDDYFMNNYKKSRLIINEGDSHSETDENSSHGEIDSKQNNSPVSDVEKSVLKDDTTIRENPSDLNMPEKCASDSSDDDTSSDGDDYFMNNYQKSRLIINEGDSHSETDENSSHDEIDSKQNNLPVSDVEKSVLKDDTTIRENPSDLTMPEKCADELPALPQPSQLEDPFLQEKKQAHPPQPGLLNTGATEKSKKSQRKKKGKIKKCGGQDGLVSPMQCRKCKQTFASKTKLFTHLRESGHAQAILY